MKPATLTKGLHEAEAYLRRQRNGDGNDQASPTSPITFSDRVRTLRASLELSQSQFAERYGLPLRTVQNWEQGRRTKPDASGAVLIGLIERDPNAMANLVDAMND